VALALHLRRGPAVLLGIVTVFYLTDLPSQAQWLPSDERDWLVRELAEELTAKKKIREYTIKEAFSDRRTLLLVAVYFLAISGALGNIYWIPTFVKRLSGFSNRTVTSLLLIPALIGLFGTLANGWHSDKTAERRWHASVPLLAAGLMYGLLVLFQHDTFWSISFLLLGSGCLYAFYPPFWAMPTMILGESAAAATFGLITSVSQVGGFAGPYVISYLNERTHALTASFEFIALAYVAAGTLVFLLRIHSAREEERLTGLTPRN
jgi:MFS transporter, ACS family, tartrate transporter